MIQCEIPVCSVDGKPADQSRIYRLVKRLCGKKVADRLTYEVTVPKDDEP
jgi:hypothetical protein